MSEWGQFKPLYKVYIRKLNREHHFEWWKAKPPEVATQKLTFINTITAHPHVTYTEPARTFTGYSTVALLVSRYLQVDFDTQSHSRYLNYGHDQRLQYQTQKNAYSANSRILQGMKKK